MAKRKKKEPEMFKLYFDEGESGWAELISKHPIRARIANIPYSGKFNIDDVVTLRRTPDHTIWADQIVERVYPVRASFWMDEEEQYKQIADAIIKRGGKLEGAFAPREGRQGAGAMAAKSEEDVIAVLEEVGLLDRQPHGWKPNDLQKDPRDWTPEG